MWKVGSARLALGQNGVDFLLDESGCAGMKGQTVQDPG
jgi:hypothetical protein